VSARSGEVHFTFEGRLEPAVTITEEDRQNLRKSGISVPTQLGDVVILSPGRGINSAGFPSSHVGKADAVLNAIRLITQYLNGYPDVCRQLELELGVSPHDELVVQLIWHRGEMMIQEQFSGKYLDFDVDVVKTAVAALVRQRRTDVLGQRGEQGLS
jgi:hypothetical protein